MTLNEEEIEIIKELIADWGSDCPGLSLDRLRPFAEKLGVWEPEQPPTEEELKRREEFRNSPLGVLMNEMFLRSNEMMAKHLLEKEENLLFMSGSQWPVGSKLKIRLPNDYLKENKNE